MLFRSFSNSVDSSRRVIIQSSGDADTVKNLGFGTGFSNKLDYGTSLKNMNFANKPQGGRYEFEINGVSIKGLTDNSTLSDVISAINNSDAGVKVSYSSAADKFIMESTSTGAISNITMKQTYGTLLTSMFGVEATGVQSSLFSKELTGSTAIGLDEVRRVLNSGNDEKLVFQVDGKDVEITLEGKTGNSKYETSQSVLDAINSQLDRKFGTEAVRFSTRENPAVPGTDMVVLTSAEHRVGFTADNLTKGFAASLGFGAGDNLLSGSDPVGLRGKITVKGTAGDVTIDLNRSIDSLVQKLNAVAGVSASFQDGRLNITGTSGPLEIKAGTDSTGTDSEGKKSLKALFGSENISLVQTARTVQSNVVSPRPNSGSIQITSPDGTLQVIDLSGSNADTEIVNAIQAASGASVTFSNGKLEISGGGGSVSISGTDDATDQYIKDLFGTSVYTYDPKMTAQITAGQNAKITVDGITMERNTNTFELDGITMELTGTTGAGDPPISLTTSRDTDKIIDSLKSFVEDYNTLIEELNSYVAEEATYKKYAPLTDAQKKEMSDREIELWEEKSKKGLLHNDSNVSSFLSDMRMVLYSSVEDAGLALYDIGIETSDSWRDNGKLIIDEETLKSMVATNADNIRKLFTDKEQGVAVKLQEAIKEAANVSSGSPGSMVRYAGTKDVLITSNTIYDEMKRISETLSKLNTKYELERTRYWKQFNAMEQAISNMNSQSSWLTQQFSS